MESRLQWRSPSCSYRLWLGAVPVTAGLPSPAGLGEPAAGRQFRGVNLRPKRLGLLPEPMSPLPLEEMAELSPVPATNVLLFTQALVPSDDIYNPSDPGPRTVAPLMEK